MLHLGPLQLDYLEAKGAMDQFHYNLRQLLLHFATRFLVIMGCIGSRPVGSTLSTPRSLLASRLSRTHPEILEDQDG